MVIPVLAAFGLFAVCCQKVEGRFQCAWEVAGIHSHLAIFSNTNVLHGGRGGLWPLPSSTLFGMGCTGGNSYCSGQQAGGEGTTLGGLCGGQNGEWGWEGGQTLGFSDDSGGLEVRGPGFLSRCSSEIGPPPAEWTPF